MRSHDDDNHLCGVRLSFYLKRLRSGRNCRLRLCQNTKDIIVAVSEACNIDPESFHRASSHQQEQRQYSSTLDFMVKQCGLRCLTAGVNARRLGSTTSDARMGNACKHMARRARAQAKYNSIDDIRHILLDKFEEQLRDVVRMHQRDRKAELGEQQQGLLAAAEEDDLQARLQALRVDDAWNVAHRDALVERLDVVRWRANNDRRGGLNK